LLPDTDINDIVFGPDGQLYASLHFVDDILLENRDVVLRYNAATTGAVPERVISHDDFGAGFGALVFTPTPAGTQVNNLVVDVENLRLPSGVETSLKVSLRHANVAIDTGHLLPARNQLHAFTNKVQAHTGGLIPVPQANRMVIAANALANLLACRQ
jgi:hypothetical protein